MFTAIFDHYTIKVKSLEKSVEFYEAGSPVTLKSPIVQIKITFAGSHWETEVNSTSLKATCQE
jgi:hypothetical protein